MMNKAHIWPQILRKVPNPDWHNVLPTIKDIMLVYKKKFIY